ncbi:hypothetical protein HCN51_27300 [Nonomuraea sp. FMUSA5-5]|uniref:Uncharacterized protein n=1 Tax=Nonomuraea composti TaxID=2720023 RepID=A0ABX1BCS8_9ACTN|nr:hypothetical protein [Nonomuraea sp. FMUSA5-5]NJP93111.1 hypothetical protein [Nonomuraea sp. FMUSA5-5]
MSAAKTTVGAGMTAPSSKVPAQPWRRMCIQAHMATVMVTPVSRTVSAGWRFMECSTPASPRTARSAPPSTTMPASIATTVSR